MSEQAHRRTKKTTARDAVPAHGAAAAALLNEETPSRWEDMPDASRGEAPDGSQQRLTKWDLRKIHTRRMILHAAREVFADRGFIVPRVEDVARAAGISRAAFYLHFKSADDLIEALFEREVRWQLRRYRSLSSEIIRNERRMRGWLERFFASFRQERQYLLIINRALSVNPTSMGIILKERERVLLNLGRRVPELRLFNPDGSSSRERMIEMHALASRIEDLSLGAAFDVWGADFDLALDLLARALVRFSSDPDSATKTPPA